MLGNVENLELMNANSLVSRETSIVESTLRGKSES